VGDARGPGALLVALNELRGLSTGELREKYAEVVGEPTNSRNRGYLLRKIAAELQGAGDDAHAAPQDGRDAEPPLNPPGTPRRRSIGERDPRLPPPGTVLERAFNGGVVRVLILDEGFEYAAKTYGSLSAVARAATGTRWNGLLFFRLRTDGCRRSRPRSRG
jgi:hypothetical protein